MGVERRWGKHTGTGPTPPRQLGRVPDEEWEVIQKARKRAGQTLTEWAVPALLAKAKRELAKNT